MAGGPPLPLRAGPPGAGTRVGALGCHAKVQMRGTDARCVPHQRILPIDDLPNGWEIDNVLLMHQAFGSSWDPRTLGRYRKRPYPRSSEYVSLASVVGPRVVASLEVLRFPFRTRTGLATFSGLGGVATAPDMGRQGLARALILEAHRRERAAGSPFMLLYTGRTGGAHRLYESLGYRDVLEFPRAARAVPTNAPAPSGHWQWRPARSVDRRAILQVHRTSVAGSCGFTREGIDWLPREFGKRRGGGWYVLLRSGRLVGYALLQQQGEVQNCGEAATLQLDAVGPLIRGCEFSARGRWLMFGAHPFRAWRRHLLARGYRESRGSYGVLMAASLLANTRPDAVRHAIGADSRSFACGSMDAF